PHPSATRHPQSKLCCAAVRLACIRPAASVHSEPGSNSSLKVFEDESSNASNAEPDRPHYSLYVNTPSLARTNTLKLMVLIERLLMDNRHHQTPAQVTCAHCQRSRTRPQRLDSCPAGITSARGSRTSYKAFGERQHLVRDSFPHRGLPPGGPTIIGEIAAPQQAIRVATSALSPPAPVLPWQNCACLPG